MFRNGSESVSRKSELRYFSSFLLFYFLKIFTFATPKIFGKLIVINRFTVFKMIRAFLVSFFVFCFCISSSAKINFYLPEDTLHEELASLIDSLFQLDTLPLALIDKIKADIAKINTYKPLLSKKRD